jgi:hypothetical protein
MNDYNQHGGEIVGLGGITLPMAGHATSTNAVACLCGFDSSEEGGYGGDL